MKQDFLLFLSDVKSDVGLRGRTKHSHSINIDNIALFNAGENAIL